MKCEYCEYEWTPKKASPVSCPRCKQRLDRPRRVVGLQIGGKVGPNDSVGMHISIPIKPGVGVTVDLNNQFDVALRSIAKNIGDHPKSNTIRKTVNEAINDRNGESKLQKIHTVVMTCAGITKVAKQVAQITKLLGF
ncbi:MAG: hypothetical protein ABIE74_04830 [Pseudomonadota bacterium]